MNWVHLVAVFTAVGVGNGVSFFLGVKAGEERERKSGC